jgi:tRNA dimethylallyltransferase
MSDLLVLTGPTASGKSRIALELASRHGLEILSADSMSVYRRLDIGTAKPTAEERARVRHWAIDLVEPWQTFDTARYVAEADRVLADAAARGQRLLVVGGTPLYLMALLRGFFAGPSADPELRARFAEREASSPGALHEELSRVDPESAARIHRHDTKRLVRALEVFTHTGRPISELQQQFDSGPPRYPHRLVALSLPRDELKARVRARTTRMLEAGLVDEVRGVLAAGGFSRTAAEAIGYAETLAFLRGEIGADQLGYAIRTATHRLVRKQETWFRRFRDARRLALAPADASREVEMCEEALLS